MIRNHKSPILHLGSGMNKIPGTIGVDINRESKADVIADLNIFPYPFKTNQFKQIIAENIIEHLDDIPKVMAEIHRIAKNGAIIFITTGHFSSLDSFTDPTHKHFFTSRTFDYFIPGTQLHKFHYISEQFKKISVTVGPTNTGNLLLRLLLLIINKYLLIYEKRFAFIFPVGVITYELQVIKDKSGVR